MPGVIYITIQLFSLQPKRLGFAEGIGLAPDGTVSEGAGENIFIVKDGALLTPDLSHSVLGGLTRHTVMTLARQQGLEVRETSVPRELLYLADELFFTGTAVEITPIRSVDRIPVGAGHRGPITEALQRAFFGLFSGATNDQWGWLDYVDMNQSKRAVAAAH
jgi:branched-chain amino acid aminotransferase